MEEIERLCKKKQEELLIIYLLLIGTGSQEMCMMHWVLLMISGILE